MEVGELLAEADGLADCEVVGDDVGLITDFVGLGLPTVGLGGLGGCTTTTLEGVGVGLKCGLGCGLTVRADGLTLGEFSCRAVPPVFPLVWSVE